MKSAVTALLVLLAVASFMPSTAQPPNLPVPLNSGCSFDGACRSPDLLCDPVLGCTLRSGLNCSNDLNCFGPFICLNGTCQCCGVHTAVLNPFNSRFG